MSTSCWAQTDDFTIRVEVPVASVDVSVVDHNGQPVEGLRMEDFEVVIDGISQPLRYFGDTTAPFHLYLLLDASASTDDLKPFMELIVGSFLDGVRDQDLFSVGVFGATAETIVDWRERPQTARRLIGEWVASEAIRGTTEFYESLERTLDQGFVDITERRAIIILTDGRDASLYRRLQQERQILNVENDREFANVLRKARDTAIPVYFVALNTDRNLRPEAPGNEYRSLQRMYPNSAVADLYLEQVRIRMELIARETAGGVMIARTTNEVARLFETIAARLGQAYSLGWIPDTPAGDPSGAVEVRVARPEYVVHLSRSEF